MPQKLTSSILSTIVRSTLPESRRDIRNLLFGDWERVFQIALYLGFDLNTENLDLATQRLIPDFSYLKSRTIDKHRQALLTLDKHLKTTHLSEFEERLERLRNEIIPVAVVTSHGSMTYAEMAAQEKLSRKNGTGETIDITATTL